MLLHLLLLAWALLAQRSPTEARRPLPAQVWSHMVLSLLNENLGPLFAHKPPCPQNPPGLLPSRLSPALWRRPMRRPRRPPEGVLKWLGTPHGQA